MQIQWPRQDGSVRIDTPAKLNLFLEVLGKRSDGYHELSTVMCPIDLWDRVEVWPRGDQQVVLELILPGRPSPADEAWNIPQNPTNLVVRAVELARSQLAISTGCHIRLKKNIPAAAGLGGASSDAAAAVVASLLLWSQWDRLLASHLCAQLGSDLNFFLGSEAGFGLMHATGRGETTRLLPQQPPLAFWMTHPPRGCATSEIFRQVKLTGGPSKTANFLAACETGQESKIGAAMFNGLQLPASKVNRWIDVQLNLLANCGCQHTQMTGSGSSCFGLAPPHGSVADFAAAAAARSISRIYQVQAWYGPPIEQQINRRRSIE